MAQRYIYLSDELNAKLKKEENASALIQTLLVEHYKKVEFDNLSKEEIKKLIEVKKIEIEAIKKIEALENV